MFEGYKTAVDLNFGVIKIEDEKNAAAIPDSNATMKMILPLAPSNFNKYELEN